MGFLQTIWGKVAAGSGIALLVLLLLEGGLRLAGVPDSGLYEGDPNTIWWLRPGLDREVEGPEGPFQLQINELGMRGELPPDDGEWTLALGCSTTMGWGVDVEEAWPSRLAEKLGQPVINGGQPGWSTHQALAHVDEWLAREPTRVILGYVVRDAQTASRPDSDAQSTSWWMKTALARWMMSIRTAGAGSADFGTPAQSRVPPDAYRENLRKLVEMSGSAEVILLSFPQIQPLGAWESVQSRLGTHWAPRLGSEFFFTDDPVHLTAEGHQELADWMAERLESKSSP